MMKDALPECRSAVLSVRPDLQHLVLCPKAGSPAGLSVIRELQHLRLGTEVSGGGFLFPSSAGNGH